MGKRFRRFLAATELAGGLMVLATPLILSAQGFTLAWWYWVLLLSFGGTAVAAGIRLWRDDPAGWRLSKLLQALQVVQFQTSTFGIGAVAGLQLRLLVSEAGFTVGPVFAGTFSIAAGDGCSHG